MAAAVGLVFHQLTVETTVITEGLWLPRAGDTAGKCRWVLT